MWQMVPFDGKRHIWLSPALKHPTLFLVLLSESWHSLQNMSCLPKMLASSEKTHWLKNINIPSTWQLHLCCKWWNWHFSLYSTLCVHLDKICSHKLFGLCSEWNFRSLNEEIILRCCSLYGLAWKAIIFPKWHLCMAQCLIASKINAPPESFVLFYYKNHTNIV